MSTQYYTQSTTREPSEGGYNPTKMRSNPNRIPLRPRQLNVENGSSTSRIPAPSVEKKYARTASTVGDGSRGQEDKRAQGSSTRSNAQFHGPGETIEIEELRRKPNGEGHTVHRYLRGRMLGKGGFAKVYTCESLDTNRMYAVKIVPKANLVKSRARQKLQAEIKIHRILKHKHVCEYKHFFEDKTNCYILLELCHNHSMNELIKRRKRLTEPEVKYYLSQLLQSVQYMHNINVIHRDLKLGNLFLDKQLRVKVGDLGLATKLTSSDEKRKTICGTPNYIAPEVIDGNKEKRGHSFEVDVWSMGVIAYTLLIGKPPYESKDVKSTYQRILANQYSFPSHIPISEHAKDLISRMLQTLPDKRPSLEYIQNHPFFTHDASKIPKSLPSCCTHVAPDWQEDADGNLVPVLAEAEDSRYQSQSSSRRKQEYRGRSAVEKIEEKPPSPQRIAQTKDNVEAIARQRQKQSANQFYIYDDAGDLPPTHNSQNMGHEVGLMQENRKINQMQELAPQLVIEGGNDGRPVSSNSQPKASAKSRPTKKCAGDIDTLTKKISAFSLKESLPRDSNEPECFNKPSCHNGDQNRIEKETVGAQDNDMKALEAMHTRLKGAIDNSTTGGGSNEIQSIPPQSSGVSRWVTRYVDYTSKYGLGFLLNDGSAGVYFNDSTKAVLAAKGESFIYVERKKSHDDENGNIEQVCEEHTLTTYPDSLQKKVTLLKHFRNYLIEQETRDGDIDYQGGESDEDSPLFLKKWVRTKHAILFRLSNKTVQVVFYDHTEILLSSEGRIVTYVDKKMERKTYYLEDVLTSEQNDVKKRLKYAEGILHQLISCGKK